MIDTKINKYTERMRAIADISDEDVEEAHVKADELIIEFLREAQYTQLAEAYDDVYKWYA